jgi:hypothetical protein
MTAESQSTPAAESPTPGRQSPYCWLAKFRDSRPVGRRQRTQYRKTALVVAMLWGEDHPQLTPDAILARLRRRYRVSCASDWFEAELRRFLSFPPEAREHELFWGTAWQRIESHGLGVADASVGQWNAAYPNSPVGSSGELTT